MCYAVKRNGGNGQGYRTRLRIVDYLVVQATSCLWQRLPRTEPHRAARRLRSPGSKCNPSTRMALAMNCAALTIRRSVPTRDSQDSDPQVLTAASARAHADFEQGQLI
jgi:hypothetical protein